MGEETKSSSTTILHTAEGEKPKKVATATAVEEESNKVVATLKEKLKKIAFAEGEKLKNDTVPSEGGEELKKLVTQKTIDEVIFEVEPCTVKEMEVVQSFIDAHGGDVSSVE